MSKDPLLEIEEIEEIESISTLNNYKKYFIDESCKEYINLDMAATTPPLKEVMEKVNYCIKNYGSIHRGYGHKSELSSNEFESSRNVIKDFVNARSDDYVIFSKNTTEGMNLLAHLFSFIQGSILVSAIEHSSSWLPFVKAEGERKWMESSGYINPENSSLFKNSIKELGVSKVMKYEVSEQGEFNYDMLESLCRKHKKDNDLKVKCIVVTASSNLTGYCPDIKRISDIAKKYQAILVVDGCQYIQHHPINISELGIDFLVASGHKMYAPFGSGFIVGRKKIFDMFPPYQIGGGNIDYVDSKGAWYYSNRNTNHDPGTPNLLGAISIATAMRELKRIGFKNIIEYEKKLAKRLYEGLSSINKIKVFIDKDKLSTVIPFQYENYYDGWLVDEHNNFAIREGYFCVYNVIKKLYGIDIMDYQIVNGEKILPKLCRASISFYNTVEEVNLFIEYIKRRVEINEGKLD